MWRGMYRELGVEAELVDGTHALTGSDQFTSERVRDFVATVSPLPRTTLYF